MFLAGRRDIIFVFLGLKRLQENHCFYSILWSGPSNRSDPGAASIKMLRDRAKVPVEGQQGGKG